MLKPPIAFFCLLLLVCGHTFAQRGKDGSLVVGASNIVRNEYTSLTANASTGNTSITVASNNLNANGRFSGPLAAGDLVMIIQMQGVSLNASPAGWDPNYSLPFDETWGAVTNLNNCGNYEFAEVYSVSGANTINLVCGLKYNYTSTGKVQVIRVPRYLTVTVNASSSLTCDPWNGITGGVVAVEVLNDITINNTGSIHANERGFRGGLCSENISFTGTGQFSRNDPGEGAEKGEGVFGYQAEYNVLGGGMYCRGAAGNAGGGGNGHNAGGGGGGNAGNPALWTGMGNPDASGLNWGTAWNLESAGFATHTSTGGGRGGYSFSSANRNAITEGPGDTDWAGDNRRQVGGLGGRALDYSTGKIFMGGGGGAGDMNNDDGGQGGNGGGIVYILGYGNVNGAGSINSNGQAGYNASGAAPALSGVTGNDGAGGGGSGGTVIVNIYGTVSGITLNTIGGNGGSQVILYGGFSTNQEAEGPGGGGGGGYIGISAGTPTRTASGGNNGTTNSRGLSEFIPNGATRGGAGNNAASITPTVLTVSNISACIGDDINIGAALGGYIYPGTQIVWYNAAVAGSVIYTGNTYTQNNVTVSDTLWVGFCPGWFRIPVILTVSGPICIASADTTICSGNSVNLNVVGGTSYSWSPSATLDDPNIANPVATPVTTTTYLVTAYEGVCEDVDSVTLTVAVVNAAAGPDTVICSGQSVQINAAGGGSYIWDNGPINFSQIVSPVGTTTYTVTVTAPNTCTATADVTVHIADYGSLNSIAETTCDPSNITFSVPPDATGATSYTFTWYESSGIVNPCPSSVLGMNQVMQEILPMTQATLFQTDFNTYSLGNIGAGTNGWREYIVVASTTQNRWSFGNGGTSTCLNIRNNTGYTNYTGTDTCNKIAYYNTPINCNGYHGILISFDWKAAGQVSNDYGNLVYTTDLTGTSGWTNVVATQFQGQATWQSVIDLDISTALLNKTILLGFQWRNNSTTQSLPAFCVDNISLRGLSPPVSSYDPPGPIASDMTYICLVTSTNGACHNISLVADNCSQVTMDCPMPIQLISFSGEVEDDRNILSWITASEINNNYFELERSTDAHSFVKIANIDGSGNTNQTMYYQFEDMFPDQESYYRLKQVDFDGTYSFSEVILLSRFFTDDLGFNIWPNPAVDEIHISIPTMMSGDVLISIFDQTGRIVANYNTTDDDIPFQTIDITGLNHGVYSIVVRSEHVVSTGKLIKF